MKNTAVMSSPVGSWGELRFQMPGKTRVSKDYIKITLTVLWKNHVTLML